MQRRVCHVGMYASLTVVAITTVCQCVSVCGWQLMLVNGSGVDAPSVHSHTFQSVGETDGFRSHIYGDIFRCVDRANSMLDGATSRFFFTVGSICVMPLV